MSFYVPKNGFKFLADPKLESATQVIIASLVSNPYFPTPEPSIADMNTALSDFSAAVSKAATGDRTEIEIKKQKKEALALKLNLLANFVAFKSEGDLAKLRSSGFPISKPKEPKMLGVVESSSVSNGINPGEIISTIKIKNAKSVAHQWTPDPLTADSVWQSEVCTSSKCVISGLESGKKYWFRQIAVGSRDQSVITNPISRIPQ